MQLFQKCNGGLEGYLAPRGRQNFGPRGSIPRACGAVRQGDGAVQRYSFTVRSLLLASMNAPMVLTVSGASRRSHWVR